jgi:peptidoglycan/LPS O-acetylase OafA/YrhL
LQNLGDQVTRVMPRFIAVDGLRCWMAWLVVASHIVQQSGLKDEGPTWHALFQAGNIGVQTFIIISGFVITHLLVERPQPYVVYLIPRFMRLFPAYAISCLAGGTVYVIASRWADPAWFTMMHGEEYSSQTHYLVMHMLAHLTMLHGAIPNTILPLSEYVFLAPAWSVSLEWQFYIVAPVVIWFCRRGDRAAYLVIATVFCTELYSHFLGSLWRQPSMLIGSGVYFVIGISCRLWTPRFAGMVRYPAAVGLGFGFLFVYLHLPSLAIWLTVYSFMLKPSNVDGRIEQTYALFVRSLLESRVVGALAERSYSTYLLHIPVIMLIATVAGRRGIPMGAKLACVMMLAFPITLVLQEMVYRFVEIPGRRLGKLWSQSHGGRAILEIPQDSVAGAKV